MKNQTKDLTQLPVNRLYTLPWGLAEEFKIWAIQNGSSASKEVAKLIQSKLNELNNEKA
jgi:hypothetical protein